MITENYVSFEVAKLLKEKGFDTFKSYGWDEELFDKKHPRNFSLGFDSKEHWISCPTHQMAMKWLREVHKVNIEIHYNRFGENYKYLIIYKPEVLDDIRSLGVYFYYEEAVEAALKYCLENLI